MSSITKHLIESLKETIVLTQEFNKTSQNSVKGLENCTDILTLCQHLTGTALRDRLLALNFDPNAETLCDATNPLINNYIVNEVHEEVIHIIEAFSDTFNPNLIDWENKNALITAAKTYSADDVLLAILKQNKIKNMNAVDTQGRTALHFICCYAKTNLIAPLIKAGAQINIRDKKGRTPLDYASLNEKEIREILKSIQINPDRDLKATYNNDKQHVPCGTSIIKQILDSQQATQQYLRSHKALTSAELKARAEVKKHSKDIKTQQEKATVPPSVTPKSLVRP